MFKKGQRVKLLVDDPDDNEYLNRGAKGTVLGNEGDNLILVGWDMNVDHLSDTDRYEDSLCRYITKEEFTIYNGRFWWVNTLDIELLFSFPAFRKQKKGEPIKQYRISKKIYELDMTWKEKQNAKTNPVSL